MSEDQPFFMGSKLGGRLKGFKCTQDKPHTLSVSLDEWASAEATVVYEFGKTCAWWAGIDPSTYEGEGDLGKAVRQLPFSMPSAEFPGVTNGKVDPRELNIFLLDANVELLSHLRSSSLQHGAQLSSSSVACPAVMYSGTSKDLLLYQFEGSGLFELIDPVIWSWPDKVPEVQARHRPSLMRPDKYYSEDIHLPNGTVVPKAVWQFNLSQKVRLSDISAYLRRGEITKALTEVRQGLAEVLDMEMSTGSQA